MSTKTKRKPVETKRPRTATKCRGCGKPIAEQLLAEALCCECRYGGMVESKEDSYELHIYHN
jgi:hypothetical protein